MITLQQSFLAYLPSLTCAQIKIYHLLNFLCGQDSRWIAISLRNVGGPLNMNEKNTCVAVRGLLASGLIQKQEQGTKKKSWYRTTPNLPLLDGNWMSKLSEKVFPMQPPETVGNSPSENCRQITNSSVVSVGKLPTVQYAKTVGKSEPPILHLDDVSAPASLYDINHILPVSTSVGRTDRPTDEKVNPEAPREAEIEAVVQSKLAGRLSQKLSPALRGRIAAALNGAELRQFSEAIDQRGAKITSLGLLEHIARDCAETQDAWRAARKPEDKPDPAADQKAAAQLHADPKRLKLARKKAELQHPLTKIERMALEL